jgi:hypothetical protein
VCVLARVFEEAGLTTLTIAMVREHAEKVKAPRVLFVPFPFGYALGKPNDPPLQHRVIGAAIALLQRAQGPALEDFPEEEAPAGLVQASGVQPRAAEAAQDPANEVTTWRAFYERWLEDHNGRTAVGLCGIPQRRWRGVIRFLESYSRGEDVDLKERPAAVPVPQFIRYCVDDLKAFYYEARMAQRPAVSEPELHRWFWGETAVAQLIRAVAQRMTATDDPALKYFAYGLAR